MNKFALFFILLSFGYSAIAQELNCKVKVDATRLAATAVEVFSTMEEEIRIFMNGQKWTEDRFNQDEKIDCEISIQITDDLGGDNYKATTYIYLGRPVFNADYQTPLFTDTDKNWAFKYSQFQDMTFNENNYTSELTSLLAFYANIFIGTYYDSFSPSGGTPYFLKAQTIATNANNADANNKSSWGPGGGKISRYSYVENVLNNRYKLMRDVYYEYHAQGLDVMYDNEAGGRATILSSIDKLKKVYDDRSNTMIMQSFFQAKTDEIVKVMERAKINEKTDYYNKLSAISPSNSSRFQKILSSR